MDQPIKCLLVTNTFIRLKAQLETCVMHSVFSYFALLFFQTNLSVHHGVVDSSSPSQKKVFGSDTTTKVVGSVINPHGFSKEGKTISE